MGELTRVEETDALGVRLLTCPLAFSRQMLVDLVPLMVAAGNDTGCELDGFQVAVPPPPAWWKFWHW